MPNGHGDPLGAVMRDGRLKPSAKLVFRWLWWQCGGRAGELFVRLRPIGEDLCLDPKTVRRCLEQLNQTGRICLKPRPQKSLWHVYVSHPTDQTADWPQGPADGNQRRLPFDHERGGSPPDHPDRSPPDHPDDLDQFPGNQSGPVSGQVSGQVSEPAAQLVTDQRVRPPPDDPEKGLVSEQNGNQSRSLIGTKDKEDSCLPKYQRTTRSQPFIETNEGQGPDSADDRATQVGFAVAEAIGTFTERTSGVGQKRRLVDEIRARAGRNPKGKPLADWVCGAAADLFLLYGVPLKELDRIWTDMEAMRHTAKGLYNPPGFFSVKITELAEQRVGSFPPRHLTKTEKERS